MLPIHDDEAFLHESSEDHDSPPVYVSSRNHENFLRPKSNNKVLILDTQF